MVLLDNSYLTDIPDYIKSLDISLLSLKKNFIKNINNLPESLIELNISDNKIYNINNISHLNNITYLNLSHNYITSIDYIPSTV